VFEVVAEELGMIRRTVAIVAFVTLLAGFGGALSQVQAAYADVTSPAGTVGGTIIVFSPLSVFPVGLPTPSILVPRGLGVPVFQAPGANMRTPVLPSILVLTPTPATGSLVVPLRVAPALGWGPSLLQLQLVIPGPNPAQNTTVNLAQLLNTLLASMQPAGTPGVPLAVLGSFPVSVLATSSR
jgi:hypothetical protein